MTDIYSVTYAALSAIGHPVREHGTYGAGETLPQTFITYQLIGSPNSSHADNLPTSTTYRVQVNVYSRDPAITQAADGMLRAALMPAGFLRMDGRGLPFDHTTGHYGYTCDYRYYDSP